MRHASRPLAFRHGSLSGGDDGERDDMSSLPFPGKVPKMDVIYIIGDQKERRDQPCERVSVLCRPTCVMEHYKCKRHGCPWPDEGECPTKERPLGRPPLGTTGGPFPVG